MRAVRFSAELGFKIEKSTSDSILKNRQLLSDVSKERLQVEFTKLITGKYATDVIRKYHAVIEVFIPGACPTYRMRAAHKISQIRCVRAYASRRRRDRF